MKPSHLAPIALVMMAVQTLRSAAQLVVLILFLAAVRDWWSVWLVISIAAVLVAALIWAGLRYWRLTYLLAPAGITIDSGVFQRQSRHIPYQRIQTLQRQQWFFLRPFKLETLTIETAGQEDTAGEAQLLAVPQSVGDLIDQRRMQQPADASPQAESQSAAQMVTAVATTPSASTTAPTPGPKATAHAAQYTIDRHDLNLYAVSSLGAMPLLAVLLALWQKLPRRVLDDAMAYLVHLALVLIVGVVLVGVLLSLLISYLSILQRYYQFQLRRSGDTLTATRGYFKRITTSVRVSHLQALRVKQTILRQWLRLATVQALVASNAAEEEDENDLVLLPVLKTDAVLKVMQPFVAWLPTHVSPLTPVPQANRWLYVRNALLGWLVADAIMLGVTWLFWPQLLRIAAVAAVALLVMGVFQGRYASQAGGVAIVSSQLLVLQTGHRFQRERFFIPRLAIQSVELHQSIWMRKRQRLHLIVNVRQGDGNEGIALRYLDQQTAVAVRQWYLREPK